MISSAVSPPGRRFWVMPEMQAMADDGSRIPGPVFSISVTARVFFGRSASWIRVLQKPGPDSRFYPDGAFFLDGEPMQFAQAQLSNGRVGARVFRLSDIEPMAWSLYEHEVLTRDRLGYAIDVVKGIARLNGVIRD